jgi:hypothetical protein
MRISGIVANGGRRNWVQNEIQTPGFDAKGRVFAGGVRSPGQDRAAFDAKVKFVVNDDNVHKNHGQFV